MFRSFPSQERPNKKGIVCVSNGGSHFTKEMTGCADVFLCDLLSSYKSCPEEGSQGSPPASPDPSPYPGRPGQRADVESSRALYPSGEGRPGGHHLGGTMKRVRTPAPASCALGVGMRQGLGRDAPSVLLSPGAPSQKGSAQVGPLVSTRWYCCPVSLLCL